MRATLQRDLTAAVKARDTVAVPALRSLLAAIANAEAVPVDHTRPATSSTHVAGATAGLGATEAPRRDLTAADLHALVENEIGERLAAADECRRAGRTDAATRLGAEADLLRRYLPPLR